MIALSDRQKFLSI